MRVSKELSKLIQMEQREKRDPRAVTVIDSLSYRLLRSGCVQKTSDGMGVQLTDKGRNKVTGFQALLDAAIKEATNA